MSLFSRNKQSTSKSSSKKVVLTGKRVRGAWTMESTLDPPMRRSANDPNVLVAENRRVRTLH
jgi:hypothetical protein